MKHFKLPVYLIIFQAMLTLLAINAACGLIPVPQADATVTSAWTAAVTPLTWPGTVQVDLAPVRQFPEVDSEKIGELISGQAVTVMGVVVNSEGNWLLVSTTKADGGSLEGWVTLEFIRLASITSTVTVTLEHTHTITPSGTSGASSTPSFTPTHTIFPAEILPSTVATTPPPPPKKSPPTPTDTTTTSPPKPPEVTIQIPTPTDTATATSPPPPQDTPPTPTDTEVALVTDVPDTPEPAFPIITFQPLITLVLP